MLGADVPLLVQQGELWRLVTANFQSLGLVHFLALTLGLLGWGLYLEKLRGPWVVLAAWTAGSVGGWGWAAVVPHAWPLFGGTVGFAGLATTLLFVLITGRDVPPQSTAARRLTSLVLGLGGLAFLLEFLVLDNPAHLGGALGGAVIGVLTMRGSRLMPAGVVATSLLAWGVAQVYVDMRAPVAAAGRYVAASEGHGHALGELAFVAAGEGLDIPGLRDGLLACDDPWSSAGLAALDRDEEAFEMALRMSEPDAREALQGRWDSLTPAEPGPR